MDNETIEKQIKNADLFNKLFFGICFSIATYCLFISSYWAALFFAALSISGLVGIKQDRSKLRKRLIKFQAKRASKSSGIGFTVETRSKESERTQSDDIQDLDIPPSEKIKRVAIQNMNLNNNETIFAERHHKEYTITVMPQAKDCFEFDSNKKVTVFVIAGSKEEAFDKLSSKLSGRYSYTDENSNIAESGRWYDGNKYSLEILKFEKHKK